MEKAPDCRDCWFRSFDMDGEFCTHDLSMKVTMFGLGLNAMRREGADCGPDATLYQHKDEVPFE